MKKIHYLPLVLFCVYIAYSLGFNLLPPFRAVTIQEVQFKSDDSLSVGKDRSNINGDSVTIVGRVVAPPTVSPSHSDNRVLLRGTSSWTCYMQDTANGLYGGIVIRQGSRFTQTLINQIDTGAIIRVKGYVGEFLGTGLTSGSGSLTQIALDTLAAPVQIDILQASGKRPAPKLVNVSDFSNGDYPNGGTINYVGGEKYEGMYVEFRNVTVGPGTGNRQPFSLLDANGNKIYMRDFSNFFSTSPSGDTLVPGYTNPQQGAFVNYIRGVIINANNEGAFGNQIPYAIVPIYPNDLSLGNAPPILSTPLRNPGVPTSSDSPVITVTATDPALNPLTVANVSLLYKFNGGAFTTLNMPLVTGNIYSGSIPPAANGTLVEYIIKATDNLGAVRLLPTDTSRSKLFYVVRSSDSMSVQDVQYCPNNGGHSGFEGANVRGIEGICTADTSDIRNFNYSSAGGTQTSPRRVIIQNGQGINSGIWLFGSPTDIIRRGDRVRVKGVVEENFSVTRINLTSPTDLVVISTNNPLPTPEILTTSVLANNKADGDPSVEVWESVLVRINTPSSISCINAGIGLACTTSQPLIDSTFRRNFGEILVKDVSNVDARIELQDGGHTFTNNWDGVTAGKTLLTKNDIVSFYQGILFFSFSNYKLVPRKNADFGTVTFVGINSNNTILPQYSLSQNYPNPFNPVTQIRFNMPVSGNTVLKVYDMVGKEVKTLVNQYMNAGSYNVDFDGSSFSSGVYFYRIEATGLNGNRFVDTKRMVLVK
ncbi:hypothetical protein BH10BAC5_BH10BAC5_00990 [soil metagenome]